MTAQDSPAFQFYPSDFLGSPRVRVMSVEEIGAYTLLLCLDWELGGFTLDEAREFLTTHKMTAEMFDVAWVKLAKCFDEKEGRYSNPRLARERKKQREWRRKSSKGGKLGAAKRWGKKDKGGHEVVITTASPNDGSPSPTPTPSPVTTTPTHDRSRDALFEEAWAVYPKRPGNSRAESYKQWLARVRQGVDPLDMLEGARRYAKYVEEEQTEPRYRKQAQTFFGPSRHFENDYTPSRPADSLTSRVAQLMAEEDAAEQRTLELLKSRGVA
jgi:uncharacterized protein YdaU (DUF1376 family)